MNKERTKSELITVAVVNKPYEASMIQSFLEEKDIVVFLQNELAAQLYSNAAGGIEIQVPAEDAEKARKLLVESGHIS